MTNSIDLTSRTNKNPSNERQSNLHACLFCFRCVDVEIHICNWMLWVHGFVDKTKKESQHALQDLQIDEMPPIA